MSGAPPAAIGEVLNGYRLDRVIGQGGMGSVYAAIHVESGRRAAVKVLATAHAADKELVSRFMQEARIASEIRHPNIVEVFELIELEKPRRVACVMELVDGPVLTNVLTSGPLTFVQSMNAAVQLAGALAAVHEVGVIHRDLKPSNIMVVDSLSSDLTRVPAVKILDFGIAKATQDTPEHRTRTGLVLGTPQYMAPEQIMGEEVSAATDLYALGEILFEMLTGERIFQGNNNVVFRAKVLGAPSEIAIPENIFGADRISGLVRATLAYEPAARPGLGDFRAALSDLLEEYQRARGSGRMRAVAVSEEKMRESQGDELATQVAVEAIAPDSGDLERVHTRPQHDGLAGIDAAGFGDPDTLRSRLDSLEDNTDPPQPAFTPPEELEQPLNTGFFQRAIEAEFSEADNQKTDAQPAPMMRPTSVVPGASVQGGVIEPEVFGPRGQRLAAPRAKTPVLTEAQRRASRASVPAARTGNDPRRVVIDVTPDSQSSRPALLPARFGSGPSGPSGPAMPVVNMLAPVESDDLELAAEDGGFGSAATDAGPGGRASRASAAARVSGSPRSRSRLLAAFAVVVIASLLVLVAVMLSPELQDRASIAVTKGVDTIAGAPAVNPLAGQIDHWRVTHTQDSRNLEEHLDAARRISAEDTWRSSEAAEVEAKLALFLDPNSARAIALYVENRLLWREELLTKEERQMLEEAVVFATARQPESPDVLRAIAAVARMRGELPRCVEVAEKLLVMHPNDARATLELVRCLLLSADAASQARAIKEAERVRTANPEMREATRMLARAYANVGRYGAALALLEDRLEEGRAGGRSMLLKGDLERELRRLEEAEKFYQLAATREPDNPLPRLALAGVHLELGKAKSAAMIYRLVNINRASPPHLKARAQAGAARAMLLQNEHEKALENADSALATMPGDAGSHLVRAEIALEKNELAKAREHIDRAIALEKGAAAPLVMRGRIRLAEKRPSEGLADLEVALASNPSDLRLRALYAGAAFAAGANGAARLALEEAQRLDPSGLYADALDDDLDIELGALRAALAQLERAAQRGEHARDAAGALGMLHYSLGNRAEAASAFQRALTATTGVERLALVYDAQLAIEDGALARAERAVQTLVKKDQTSAIAQLLLARLYVKKRNTNLAREAYRAALSRQPDLIAATAELAATQLEGGGKEVAVLALADLYRAHPRVVRLKQLLADAGY